MLFFFLFLFLFWENTSFSSPSASETLPGWTCKEPQWNKEPKLTEGIFTARISTECKVYSSKKEAISWLFKKLQMEYSKPEKYQIHKGPLRTQEGPLIQIYYDLTDNVTEEDSDLAIRQDVYLKTDEKKHLLFSTSSKAIRASGTASYLKEVSFLTDVSLGEEGFYWVKLENEVHIERPWFALALLFKPMSASITESKFEKARDKLLDYLLSDPAL